MKKKVISVLFVCMGNICRSPAGEAILKHMLKEESSVKMHIESCGIGDWHLGQGPDKRIQEAAQSRGIAINSCANQFQDNFFDTFDYILVADKEVLKVLYHYAKKSEHKAKIFLMTAFSPLYMGEEVPDPYYLAGGAFDLVLDMLEDSCQGFIKYIKSLA